MTPQQMRELADRLPDLPEVEAWMLADEISAALRTAADQLEAVQAWAHEHGGHFPEISELDAILTADTAPQEGDHV